MPIETWRATCIQMPSRVARTASSRSGAWTIIKGNIERGLALIDRCFGSRQAAPRLVLLPEFAFQGPPRGESVDEWIEKACYPVPGEITAPFQAKAAELGIYIGGNQFEADPEWPHRHFNTSWLSIRAARSSCGTGGSIPRSGCHRITCRMPTSTGTAWMGCSQSPTPSLAGSACLPVARSSSPNPRAC